MTEIAARDLIVPASDGFALAATLHTPPASSAPTSGPVVGIGSAAGVPRYFYTRFARFMAELGVPTLTFDYRGIGGSRPPSLRGFEARMRDWGEADVAGVVEWLHATFGGRDIYWVGHSYGGFGVGLAHNHHLVQRMLAVATMSGHWRMLSGLERYKAAVMMGHVLPPAVRAIGYFPGFLLGSEDMPRGVFEEWSRWIMLPDFVHGDHTLESRRNVATFRAPVRFVQVEDDPWGTDVAVQHMVDRFAGASERSIWRISRGDSGGKAIGHLGFFRSEHRETLWPEAAAWLLQGAATRVDCC